MICPGFKFGESPASTTTFLPQMRSFSSMNSAFVDNLLFEEARVALIEDFDLAHHLAHNHFEMLVVDLHALQWINVLHFVDDIFLNGAVWAFDFQDVGRPRGRQ